MNKYFKYQIIKEENGYQNCLHADSSLIALIQFKKLTKKKENINSYVEPHLGVKKSRYFNCFNSTCRKSQVCQIISDCLGKAEPRKSKKCYFIYFAQNTAAHSKTVVILSKTVFRHFWDCSRFVCYYKGQLTAASHILQLKPIGLYLVAH